MPYICELLQLIAEKKITCFNFIGLDGIILSFSCELDNSFTDISLLDLITAVNTCRDQGCAVDFSVIRMILSAL